MNEQSHIKNQGALTGVQVVDIMTTVLGDLGADVVKIESPLGEAGYPRLMTPECRPFRTKDGFICVSATTDQQWARLFGVVGRPDLAADPRFSKMPQRTFHFEAAFQYLNEAMLRRTTADWIAVFEAVDLPNGPANELGDLLERAYLRETGFFNEYGHPSEGRLVATNPAVSFSSTPSGMRRPPPRL